MPGALPLAQDAVEPALLDVRFNDGVHHHGQPLVRLLFDGLVNGRIDGVSDKNRSLNSTCSLARRAGLGGLHVGHRAHALPRHFHNSKAAGRKDASFACHLSSPLHRRRELLVVLTLGHVDEVNANDAAHVLQPQDARNFFAALRLVWRAFSFIRPGLPSTTVDVDDVAVGRFDNQVRPAPQVDCLPTWPRSGGEWTGC